MIWTLSFSLRTTVQMRALCVGREARASLGKAIGSRVPIHAFNVHVELRAHPDKLLGWKPKKDGDILTVVVEWACAISARFADVNMMQSSTFTTAAIPPPGVHVDILERYCEAMMRRFRRRLVRRRPPVECRP